MELRDGPGKRHRGAASDTGREEGEVRTEGEGPYVYRDSLFMNVRMRQSEVHLFGPFSTS